MFYIVCLHEPTDDFAVYGPRTKGPFGTSLRFRGTLDECLDWRRDRA